MPKIWFLLILSIMLLPLWGFTPREQDDYLYVVELYDGGEYQEALYEIEYFSMRYPTSVFLPYMDFIRAGIALTRGDYLQSAALYEKLIKQDLHIDLISDVYLNYSITLYRLREYARAIALLQDLGLITEHPYYVYHGNIWRGRTYAALGLQLSAEHEYRKAMNVPYPDPEVRFEYFKLLLSLDRDEEAEAIMTDVANDDNRKSRYLLVWMEHLLNSKRDSELNEFYADNMDLLGEMQDSARLIMASQAIAAEEYQEAEHFIGEIAGTPDKKLYFQALLNKQKGFASKADSIFKQLVNSNDPEIQILSYLERLKLQYDTNPDQAIQTLRDHLGRGLTDLYKGHQYLLLADFLLRREHYTDALKQLTSAKRLGLPYDLLDRCEDMIAEAYYRQGELRLARENYNRYLNTYINGRYRDRAYYRIALISFNEPDFKLAKLNFEALVSQYPSSSYSAEAVFYLGEIEFFSANYNQAIAYYSRIPESTDLHKQAVLRIAQSYFYQDRFSEARSTLSALEYEFVSFERLLLNAALSFSEKDYDIAYREFGVAELAAVNNQNRLEARSYRAYTLYYMKRFEEATSLFEELSSQAQTGDIYLYQAAKSAYQGRNYRRALNLYDRILDDYPDTRYFHQVLVEIAYCYYNLGAYRQSFDDWLNILRRYTVQTSFDETESGLLREVFNGLELTVKQINSGAIIDELLDVSELFNSEFIKFELQYMVVKLYADLGQWQDLIDQAEELRKEFPSRRRSEIELLMAESLIRLNDTQQASEIVSGLMSDSANVESLLKMAEIAALTGDIEIAVGKYKAAYELQRSASIWVAMLELSLSNSFVRFDEIWTFGEENAANSTKAKIIRIKYLIHIRNFVEAEILANQILDSEFNQYNRGQAETSLASMHFFKGEFSRAVTAFKRIRLLYKDYHDLLSNADYYYILSLIKTGALKEAQLTLWDVQSRLDDDQIIQINDMLDRQR